MNTILLCMTGMLFTSPAQTNEIRQEVKAAIEFSKSFRNFSAVMTFTEESNQSEGIIFHGDSTFAIYMTPQRVAYAWLAVLEYARKISQNQKQAEWTIHDGGYHGVMPRKGEPVKNKKKSSFVFYWPPAQSSREPMQTLGRIGPFSYGLWAEWHMLGNELHDILADQAESVQIQFTDNHKECSLETPWGIIIIRLSLDNLVQEIQIDKLPESMISRDNPKTVKDLAPEVRKISSKLTFDYNGKVLSRIVRHPSVKLLDSGSIETSTRPRVEFVIRTINFAPAGQNPPDVTASLLNPIPNGTRVVTGLSELQPIALEWRDGKVVKAIDQTALNVAEEMSKFQASEHAKTRQRWKWIGLASFGGLVLVLTAVWWWRASRKSMT